MSAYNRIGDSSFYSKSQLPAFTGIEYDSELPNNMVIASPGGVSTTYNHYTHGIYGKGDLTSDVYGWQGYRNVSGPYNNLYTQGFDSGSQSGMYPPSRNVNFRPPFQSQQQISTHQPLVNWTHKGYIDNPSIESFTPTSVAQNTMFDTATLDNYDQDILSRELYQSDRQHSARQAHQPIDLQKIGETIIGDKPVKEIKGDYEILGDTPTPTPTTIKINPYAFFILLVVGAMVFGLWYDTINIFIKQYFHGGQSLSFKNLVIWSIIFSLIFVFLMHLFGVDLITFETSV